MIDSQASTPLVADEDGHVSLGEAQQIIVRVDNRQLPKVAQCFMWHHLAKLLDDIETDVHRGEPRLRHRGDRRPQL